MVSAFLAVLLLGLFFFFFSSRRRHTRCLSDWSSDVCSSDLMLGPGWKEGCVGCSFTADHIEGALVHLEHHDVTLVVVSRAPQPEIEAFRQRKIGRASCRERV